jgi:hypothetical protein
VAAVRQTLTVTAYAGRTRVGQASIAVPLFRDETARVHFRIVDTACGSWTAKLPAITAFFVSPTAVLTGEPAFLGARAVDRAGTAIAYRWTSDCAGTFSSPGSATTAFTASGPGACTLTVQASTPCGKDLHSDVLAVLAPTGRVDVDGSFVPWPVVEGLAIAWGAGTCEVARSASDASCREPVRAGEAAALTATLRTLPAASFEWRDDCGGVFSASDLSAFPAQVKAWWTAPAGPGPVVCLLEPRLSLLGMVDALPIAVLVAEGDPSAPTVPAPDP